MKKRLLALMAKKDELKRQAYAIADKAIAENRTMTDDEQSNFDNLSSEINKLDNNIAQLTALMNDDEGVPVNSPIRDNAGNDDGKDNRFASFGEQLMAVRAAAQPGATSIDGRLLNTASGSNVGTPSDGGFLVQEDFVAELLNDSYSDSVLAQKVRRIPMSSTANTLKINGVNETSRANGSRWGGVQAYWESEAAEIAGSKPSFRQLTMTLKKLTGLCYATDELLEDAPALSAIIQQAFSDEFSFKLDDAILNGSGTGEPLGIMNSNALITIAKESSQSDVLCPENLLKMLSACYDKNGRAEWYLNQELLPYLCTLKIGDTPIYLPSNSLANAPYGTLLGKPVNFIEQANAVKSKGDILLADMSQYLITDKRNTEATQSIHVRFVYDETAFRFIYRVDGQPAWSSAKTPYKGSQAKSPFVTLAAR